MATASMPHETDVATMAGMYRDTLIAIHAAIREAAHPDCLVCAALLPVFARYLDDEITARA